MFTDLFLFRKLQLATQYSGPLRSMTAGKSFEEFFGMMQKPHAIASTRLVLKFLFNDVNILPDCRNGEVSERATRQFMIAYAAVFYPDQISYTNKSLPDNQRMVTLAKAMVERFEEVLGLFRSQTTSLAEQLAFCAAAKEFLPFFRGWLVRNEERLVNGAHDMLMFHFLGGVPETDERVVRLRKILLDAGGQEAIDELERHQERARATMTGLGLTNPTNPRLLSMGDGVLMVVVDVEAEIETAEEAPRAYGGPDVPRAA
jgi:hypothetical protein